jgi:hypothetical protein
MPAEIKVGDKFVNKKYMAIIQVEQILRTAIISRVLVTGRLITDDKERFLQIWEPYNGN